MKTPEQIYRCIYLGPNLPTGVPNLLYDVGTLADGTLYNPNGYPEDLVRQAVLLANKRQVQRAVDQTEIKLLSHHLQLERIEFGTTESLWKPWIPTKVGDARPISADKAVARWYAEEDERLAQEARRLAQEDERRRAQEDERRALDDKWHTSDPSAWITFDKMEAKGLCGPGRKTKEGLISWLCGVEFPAHHLEAERISIPAYNKALEIHAARECERVKEYRREKRAAAENAVGEPAEKVGEESAEKVEGKPSL